MIKHLYITNIDVIEAAHSQAQLVTAVDYDMGDASPPCVRAEYELMTSRPFISFASVPFDKDKHRYPIYIHTHIGMNNQAKTVLATYIGCVDTLQEELHTMRRKRNEYRLWFDNLRNACFWRRVLWVFTGITL